MKKTISTIILLSLVGTSLPAFSADPPPTPKKDEVPVAKYYTMELTNSGFRTECQKKLGDKGWSTVIKDLAGSTNRGLVAFNFWETKLREELDAYSEMKSQAAPAGTTNSAIIVAVDKSKPDLEKLKANIVVTRDCMAFAGVISIRDMSNSRMHEGMAKVSADGKIQCVNNGIYTVDYDTCKEMLDAYDMAAVAQVGLTAFNTIDYQASAADAQAEYTKNADEITAGMEAQKSGIKKQAQIANTQASFHAAKAAVLARYAHKIVDLSIAEEQCKTFELKNIATKIEQAIADREGITSDDIFGGEMATDELCAHALTTLPTAYGFTYFANSDAIDNAKLAIMQEGLEAGVKIAEGALLNKQAGKLGDAISSVNSFDPADIVTVPTVKDPCLTNPDQDGCFDIPTHEDVGFADSGISINGDWGGGNSVTDRTDEDFGSVPSGTSTATSDNVDSIGVPIDEINKAGGLASSVGAATVKAGAGGGGPSGGGGGGSAGGASAPGGGGSGGEGRGAMSAGGNPKVNTSYAGGSGSSLSYGGGSGSGSTSSKSSRGNPFADLLGKKKGSTGPNSLSFRGPASKNEISSKNGKSLFELISNRYNAVNKADRLIKYELVK